MGEGRERSPFLKRESYKHRAAKTVLRHWLEDDGFDVREEQRFNVEGWIFYPDLVAYKDGHIQAFYEVIHTHPVDWKKLSCMQHYCWSNHLELLMHEVDAEWILRQIEKPERILKFTFDLNMNKYTEQYNREVLLAEPQTK